jgi:nucleosome binding factor SPN SPT16 subunit
MEFINLIYYEAINAINSNFNVSVSGNTEDDLVINWNGIQEISVADIKTKITEMETVKTNEETAKATAQATGNQKLLDLGLTQAEATALTGYTPPVAE